MPDIAVRPVLIFHVEVVIEWGSGLNSVQNVKLPARLIIIRAGVPRLPKSCTACFRRSFSKGKWAGITEAQ